MGGVTDMLFGSSDEGGYKGEAPMLTREQQELLNKLIGVVIPQIGQGVKAYPGQMVAGPSALQTQGFDLTSQLFGSGGTGQDVLGKIIAGPGGGAYDPESATRFWETSVKAPAIKSWQEEILPAVKESFIGLNAGRSGAANRAIAKSGEDLMSSLSASLGDILYKGEQSQLDRLQNIPGLASILTQPLMSGGGVQRGIESQQLMEPYQKWQAEQGYANPWLSFISQILGTQAVQPIVQGPSSQSGLFQDVLAPMGAAYLGTEAGAGGLTSLLSMLSSKRFKRDIKTLGYIKGLRLVSFRYINSLKKRIGFIAEEVFKIHPDSVVLDKKGKPLAINYLKLLTHILG